VKRVLKDWDSMQLSGVFKLRTGTSGAFLWRKW